MCRYEQLEVSDSQWRTHMGKSSADRQAAEAVGPMPGDARQLRSDLASEVSPVRENNNQDNVNPLCLKCVFWHPERIRQCSICRVPIPPDQPECAARIPD